MVPGVVFTWPEMIRLLPNRNSVGTLCMFRAVGVLGPLLMPIPMTPIWLVHLVDSLLSVGLTRWYGLYYLV